jgi:hypothetical protein
MDLFQNPKVRNGPEVNLAFRPQAGMTPEGPERYEPEGEGPGRRLLIKDKGG